MLKNFLLLLFSVIVLASCEDENKVEQEISKMPIELKVDRFDQVFAEASPEDLPRLKENYPLLFPEAYPDSIWLHTMKDTIQQEINREVTKAFPSFEEEGQDIEDLFKHLKYYFPNQFETPEVITVTSEVDYKNKVIATDSVLLISLDTYLGEEHKFYVGLQQYLKKNFRKEQLVPDIAFAYGEQYIPQPKSRTLLASMIYYGKILYLKDKLIPEYSDAEKIGYTADEMEWARTNEEQIWRYFIEHEILFDTDANLQKRFINLAPFTKFRLQLDSESPPQLGQYIGWQIVRQFADKHPDLSLQEVLLKDDEQIFKQSNYKPRKPE